MPGRPSRHEASSNAERGLDEHVVAVVGARDVDDFEQVGARLPGVAGREFRGGDSDEELGPTELCGHERQHVRQHLGGVFERERAHRDLGRALGDVDRGGGIGDGDRGRVVTGEVRK